MCGYDKNFYQVSIILFVIGDTVLWKRLRIGCSFFVLFFLLSLFLWHRSRLSHAGLISLPDVLPPYVYFNVVFFPSPLDLTLTQTSTHTYTLYFFSFFSLALFRTPIWKVTLCCVKSWFLFYICTLPHSEWYIYQNAWPNFVTNMLKLCLREMCGMRYTYRYKRSFAYTHTHSLKQSRALVVPVNQPAICMYIECAEACLVLLESYQHLNKRWSNWKLDIKRHVCVCVCVSDCNEHWALLLTWQYVPLVANFVDIAVATTSTTTSSIDESNPLNV